MKEIKYQQKYVRQLVEGGLVLMFHTLAKSRRQGWVVIGSHRGLAPALHLGVLEDFLKEHGNLYTALEKSEQKLLNKELNKFCTALVKHVYMSQAYIME